MQLREVRPQNFHVVANLSHRADGAARGADGVALLDGDGRGDAFDAIHLRLVHAVEELSRVRRERFDVAALAFGIKRVEGEGTFARTAQTRDDDEPVQRQIEIKVLEIVVPDAAQADDGRWIRFRHVPKVEQRMMMSNVHDSCHLFN